MSHEGLEPSTLWLKVKCSTNWANGSWLGYLDSNQGNDGVKVRCLTAWRHPNIYLSGAERETWTLTSGTLDPKSSASANSAIPALIKKMVRHTRFELVTTRLKVVCSTNWANDANGVTDEARTRDNQCHKLALYQLNYGHHIIMCIFKKKWSGRRGSNSRHSAWKADALPTELFPHNPYYYLFWWRG